MINSFLTGGLLFAVFVVIAVGLYVARAKFGLEPPQYQSYGVGILLLAAAFFLFRGSGTWINPEDTVAAIQAQTAAIQRLGSILGVVLFIAGFWILTEKSRMQRYVDCLSRTAADNEAAD